MKKYLVLAFLPLLTGCFPTETPSAGFSLDMQRPDNWTTRATLTPAPPIDARYSIREAEECGAQDGPEVVAGVWPAHVPSLTLQTWRGHLLTVEAAGVRVSDCVPPLAWNTAQSVGR